MSCKLRNTFTDLAMLDCNDGVVHYIPTQLRGRKDSQITFLCSPTQLSRMDDLLCLCAESPILNEKYLEHIDRMESRYMTEIEEREVNVYRTITDTHNDNIYTVYADSTYNGIRYARSHAITCTGDLTKLWRVSSEHCYFNVDTSKEGIRTADTGHYHNQFNMEKESPEFLKNRLKTMFEFDCGDHVLNCIVRAFYIIMSSPYGVGSERLALTYLESSLPTAGIPIAKCLSADFNNMFDILSKSWKRDKFNCINITTYVSYMIEIICKSAKLFNTMTKELSTDCLQFIPEEGIKVAELKEILAKKLYNADDILEMYFDAEYIMEYPTGTIVSIYK